MATRMQQRRGTAAQWISTNSGNGPILNAGEIGYETDTNKFKIGDGTNHWINLDYFTDANSTVNPSFGSSITFEGATDNAYETTVSVTDPTADRTITIPDATGTVALTSDITVTASSTNTLTNKTVSLGSNTVSGTLAQFNTAVTDADFASLAGTETLTNKTLTSPVINTPTGITKTDVGLSAVDNTTDANKPVSTATQTALDLKLASATAASTYAPLASPTFTGTVAGVTATHVGLGNVNNTSDANKPVSTAQQTALDLKAPLASPTFTGTTSAANLTISGDLTVNGTTTIVNSTILDVQSQIRFEGVTADAFETSLIATDPTADRNISLPDASGAVVLDGNTQTLTNKSISLASNTVSGTLAQFNTSVSDADLASLAGTETLTNKTLTQPKINENVALTTSSTELNYVTGVTSAIQTQINGKQAVVANVSDVEIGYLDGVTSAIQGQLNAKQAVVLNVSDTEISYLDGVTSAIQTQIDGKQAINANVSTIELGYLDGVTSAIQTQLNNKQAVVANVSDTEIGYLDGVTSAIQTQINGKQATVANISDVEIGYLDGVTSSIQTQIDAKAPLASPTFTGTVSGITKTMVGLGSVDNTADTAKPVSTAQQTALDLKANLSGPTFTGTVSGITKSMVGLANVDNTTDASKPISTAQQTALDLKLASATAATTYETISNVALKAPLASPALTGTPTAPTAALATNTTQVATTAFVRAEVAALVGSAGATLDTLGEIATALGNDANLSTTLTSSIALKAPLASPTFTGTVTLPTGTVTSGMILDGTILDADINASAAIAQSKISGLSTSLGLKADLASPTFTGTVTIPSGASISGFAPLASPTFTGTNTVAALTVSGSGLITASSAGLAFTDGTQTKEGTPSRTPIIQKTASYTLSALTERDSLIEVSSSSATTITIPTNTAVAYPVGTSIDILQTSTGQVTIAAVDGTVTVNSTPGLKLRTTWSSCTLFKRATNTWVVYGDLTA